MENEPLNEQTIAIAASNLTNAYFAACQYDQRIAPPGWTDPEDVANWVFSIYQGFAARLSTEGATSAASGK